MELCSRLLLLWLCRLLCVASQYLQDGGMPNYEITIFFPEDRNGKCFFPFYYNKGMFFNCIKFQSKHEWCSLTETFKGYWKYCSEEDMAKCAFPFWFRRMIYWECTEDSNAYGKKWCSLTQNYNKDKIWKYCDADES
ncbi:binder of sperm protein homolog 1 isoform X2 [Artibeus jamaicensis]|uniref:binder of sperm protein homolog 1 isoform X2 n=1 Tax=Artibeus jamaicensis TaxID=9417 RepID=UPI00235A9AA0|nr:binder of sperm protein homolog 1 isoform X2 [Artibeus jamaicensis]